MHFSFTIYTSKLYDHPPACSIANYCKLTKHRMRISLLAKSISRLGRKWLAKFLYTKYCHIMVNSHWLFFLGIALKCLQPSKTFFYMSLRTAYNNLLLKCLEIHLSFCNQTWKLNNHVAFTILIKWNSSVLVVTQNYIITCFQTDCLSSFTIVAQTLQRTLFAPLFLQPFLHRQLQPERTASMQKSPAFPRPSFFYYMAQGKQQQEARNWHLNCQHQSEGEIRTGRINFHP